VFHHRLLMPSACLCYQRRRSMLTWKTTQS